MEKDRERQRIYPSFHLSIYPSTYQERECNMEAAEEAADSLHASGEGQWNPDPTPSPNPGPDSNPNPNPNPETDPDPNPDPTQARGSGAPTRRLSSNCCARARPSRAR